MGGHPKNGRRNAADVYPGDQLGCKFVKEKKFFRGNFSEIIEMAFDIS